MAMEPADETERHAMMLASVAVEPETRCDTCDKKGEEDEMTMANLAFYCDIACYNNSTQYCYCCFKEGKANTFESSFEGSPCPGGVLLYYCTGDDQVECKMGGTH